MKRSVLIAGCGYVGSAAANLFLERGWEVTGWTRSSEPPPQQPVGRVEHRVVDLRQSEEVRRNASAFEVVIHCASSSGGRPQHYQRLYGDGVRNLLDAFPRARLIFTSSTGVYQQTDGGWVDEESPSRPAPPKSRILLGAEEAVLGREGIVLRLGAIYGPGRSFHLQRVRSGTAAISPVDRYVNQIHRDDAAAALVFLAEHPQLRWPRLFNVVDNEPSLRNDVLHWLAAQLGRKLLLSSEAPPSKRGDSNKRVNNARLRALGWSPRYPSYREGFLQSVLPAANLL